jgi:DNA-binding PadR family transcriptional regulator
MPKPHHHGRHGERRHARGEHHYDGLRPHHRRGGLGRFFAHGDLRLVILNLIAEKPRHGYDVIKAIEDQVAGTYSPSPGVVYPTLTLLEELGHVEVAAEANGKKLHSITDSGRAFLDANQATLAGLQAKIAEAGRAGGPPAPVVRAMENLKTALRLRLSDGKASAEQIAAIAAALDAAALAVEKLP